MKLKYKFISDFTPELKQDIADSIDWLSKVVYSYEYKRAIKKNGYQEEDRIMKKLLDGFTVNFKIWHTNSERPALYDKDNDTILLNMDYFPYVSNEIKAGLIAHEICHENDRFDHGSHQMTGFPYFTQYRIPKMSLKEPFYITIWNWIKSIFK